ncbi:cytochrome P450 [Armillaria novae-zelandiae]|uniref:Cytochrome P450 n=1 Tax=Armillaria novae-zelandiae TaxID=153914 RepID=A0AA39NY57_9AGAR|nr:cytochrome P450 [Armillaria novae-zelandiae]
MFSLPSISFLFLLLSVLTLTRTYYRRNLKFIQKIRGPLRPSLLLGHEWMMRNQKNFGELEMKWLQEYGAVFRIGGCFGKDVLMLSDPKALKHVLHTSRYRFTKAPDIVHLSTALIGPGVVIAEGTAHQRQRKILNPAFSASQLRQSLHLFQSFTSKLINKLKHEIGNDGTGRVVDVIPWTRKVALDIIGITAFRYCFNALDDGASELREALHNVFIESQASPSPLELLYISLWRIGVPKIALQILDLIPTRGQVRSLRFKNCSYRIASEILQKQLEVVENEMDSADKDIVNLLALSYLAEDPNKRMSVEEIYSQLATFTLAGHDTTATTVAWILYELSLQPFIQNKIREEISQRREQRRGDLDTDDYDSLSLLNAVIKETLRLHPFVFTSTRVADEDSVVPLSEPITTSDDSVVWEIPVLKGQALMLSFYTYNRLPSVWGDDADKWNPERFLHPTGVKETNLGLYANLVTFGAGVRACIGWKYAVMEMQVLVTELLSTFEFSPSEEGLELQHMHALLTLTPIVKGRAHEGEQVPLRVALVKG